LLKTWIDDELDQIFLQSDLAIYSFLLLHFQGSVWRWFQTRWSWNYRSYGRKVCKIN